LENSRLKGKIETVRWCYPDYIERLKDEQKATLPLKRTWGLVLEEESDE